MEERKRVNGRKRGEKPREEWKNREVERNRVRVSGDQEMERGEVRGRERNGKKKREKDRVHHPVLMGCLSPPFMLRFHKAGRVTGSGRWTGTLLNCHAELSTVEPTG